jgi:hypothetical protein
MSVIAPYPDPYNEIVFVTIDTYDRIMDLEREIRRYLRTMGKTCPALLGQSYINFRSLLTRFVVGRTDETDYSLTIVLDDQLIVTQEVQGDECLVTLRWKECIYPCSEETRKLGNV